VTTNIRTGIDLRSGNEISKTEARAIKALPELPAGRDKWAKLIVSLTMSGKYWSDEASLVQGGELYEKIKISAARNQRGKDERAFQKRYAVRGDKGLRGITPREFLGYSAEKQLEVEYRSKLGVSEPLSYVKVGKTKAKALAIYCRVPTLSEFERELTAQVADRLRTIPRN
jgi:hypothetical protein